MGWSDCGKDSKGRPIGYGHEGTCDHEGCAARVDRGLSYACGGMHGFNGRDCDGYFCPEHLVFEAVDDDERCILVCVGCAEAIRKENEDVE